MIDDRTFRPTAQRPAHVLFGAGLQTPPRGGVARSGDHATTRVTPPRGGVARSGDHATTRVTPPRGGVVRFGAGLQTPPGGGVARSGDLATTRSGDLATTRSGDHATTRSGDLATTWQARRTGFTLIELLVVIVIILLVSAVTLPAIISAISHRQVSEAARILQAALVGARDSAIHNNAISGIRLLPDPTLNGIDPTTGALNSALPLAMNRIVPLEAAPDYDEGLVSIIQDVPANTPGSPFVNPQSGITLTLTRQWAT